MLRNIYLPMQLQISLGICNPKNAQKTINKYKYNKGIRYDG